MDNLCLLICSWMLFWPFLLFIVTLHLLYKLSWWISSVLKTTRMTFVIASFVGFSFDSSSSINFRLACWKKKISHWCRKACYNLNLGGMSTPINNTSFDGLQLFSKTKIVDRLAIFSRLTCALNLLTFFGNPFEHIFFVIKVFITNPSFLITCQYQLTWCIFFLMKTVINIFCYNESNRYSTS